MLVSMRGQERERDRETETETETEMGLIWDRKRARDDECRCYTGVVEFSHTRYCEELRHASSFFFAQSEEN